MIVADSDVLIDALRGRADVVGRMTGALRAGAVSTTAITRFELLAGARSVRGRDSVEAILAPMVVLPLDDAAAEAAAGVRRGLEADGLAIGMADYLIAGICIARHAELWTRNLAHFERVPGLRLYGDE